uniref:C-type lectin domain-containing protein n=1 Tax=Gadus morhua TaxID=8049 RepID=A0A8C5B3R3_GADMO
VKCDVANGWTDFGSYCYKLKSETTKSWLAARHDCLKEGGDLLSLSSTQEEEFVSGILATGDVWTGLHDPLQVGFYTWSDVSHTNWGPGEPNDHEGRENCVEMVSSANGTLSWWNDLNCDAHQDWICMIAKGTTPILPPIPPPPVPGRN